MNNNSLIFGGLTPDFSKPPPSINLPNNNTNVGPPRPGMPHSNHLRQFSGPAMHNQNHFRHMMPPHPSPHQGQVTNYGRNMAGSCNQNQSNSAKGRGFTQFNPPNSIFKDGNVRGCNPLPSTRSTPPHAHFQKQANYGSIEMFGTNINNTNRHSFPHFNPQQDAQGKFIPPNKLSSGQRGNGFIRGRGQRGHGGRGHFSNHNGIAINNSNKSQRQGGPAKKKKEKIDKRDLPENNIFFCDSCDRGFKTEEKYKEHVDGHQKCSYKDCPYVAAPKLVQLHMNMQHRGGLAKKIWRVESQEDVKKWRDDRKRNFPTAANIQRKKELQAERVERGQVLETKDFSKMRRGRGGGRGGRGRGRRRYNQGQGHWGRNDHQNDDQSREANGEDSDDNDGPPEETKIVRTRGNQEREDDADKSGIDCNDQKNGGDDDLPESAKIVKEKEERNASSLSLLNGYGTSSSGGDTSDSDEEQQPASLPLPEKNELLSPHQNAKMTKMAIEENEAHTYLPQPYEGCCKSLNPQTSPQESPVASPASFVSDSYSLTSHDIDPFNLNGNSSTLRTDTSQASHQRKDLPSDKAHVSLTKNYKDMKDHSANRTSYQTTNNVNAELVSASGTGNEDSVIDSSINDSEIFSEMDTSVQLSSSDIMASKGSDSCNSEIQQAKGRGTKRKHTSASCPDGDRKNQGGKRQEWNKNMIRRHDQRPQAKSYTLLEKLLAPQIRRERNKILQCVHFIVKNNFFDDEASSSS